MNQRLDQDPETAQIESAFDAVFDSSVADTHTKNVLRVGRIAARRRDAGLSWNDIALYEALQLSNTLCLPVAQ